MKAHFFIAAVLVLVCSGCVPYYYNDPYYQPYGYGPYTYPYNPPAVYVDPGVIYYYAPLPYIGLGYYGGYHGHHGYYGGHHSYYGGHRY
jgi:hypothetical protein